MLRALLLAVGQLGDPVILRMLGRAALLAALCFAAVWAAVVALLWSPWVEGSWPAGVLAGTFGTATALVVAWFSFPTVVAACIGLVLEPIAAAVERRHYPALAPARGVSFALGLACAVRCLTLGLLANVALLVLLLVPPVYAVAYYLVNGALLGREYHEVVALRRAPLVEVRRQRRESRWTLLALGVLGACLGTLPVANLAVPVVLTAAMVHVAAPGPRGS